MRGIKGGMLVALLVCASTVAAQSGDAGTQPTLAQIRANQQQIRSEVEQGKGRFEDMPGVKKRRILARQNDVFALSEGVDDLAQMAPEQREKLFNLLQDINAAISNKDDERIVCETVAKTGSNMKKRVCKSVAQRNEEREGGQKFMTDLTNGPHGGRLPDAK